MKKFIFIVAKVVATFLLLIFVFLVGNYALIPVYRFEKNEPFSGKQIYNPYQSTDSANWVRSNFHAHSKRWAGATNGSTDLSSLIARYGAFDYGYIGVSNYQDKSEELINDIGYLPIYERGWGYSKFHLLVMGNAPIYWIYPPIYSGLSSKQFLINQSRIGNDLVCLNHLAHVRGLSLDDMDYLTGYDLTEVWGGMGDSRKYWDRALSAGHRSFLLANDDSHNTDNTDEVSRFVTFVQSSDRSYPSLISALKRGFSYGVSVPNVPGENWDKKIERTRSIARFNGINLKEDTVIVSFTQKADSIVLIGQDGIRHDRATDTTQLKAKFLATDTYLRAEAYFSDGVRIILNPLYRYSDDPLIQINRSVKNQPMTLISIFGYGLLAILMIVLIVYIWKPKKKKHRHPRYYSSFRNNKTDKLTIK